MLPTLGRLLALAWLASAVLPAPAVAHETIDESLARLDATLLEAPGDAELWRQRASLQRGLGDLASAQADLARACALGLAPAQAERERGLNARAEHRLDVAERHLRRASELAPRDTETLLAHAEILAALGRNREAAGRLKRAIERTPHPGPGLLLAHARALAASGDAVRALRVLDEAERRLGPVPALTQEALALELRAGRPDAALARLERASAPAHRRESWLVQRAEILEHAGRLQEAASQYAAVLSSLETLPLERRATPASAQLATRARAGAERLARTNGTAAP